jgi:CHRD domain
MRKVALLAALLGTGILAVGAVAVADDDDGSGRNGARLNGYQEVNSISTAGFGSFHLKINRDEQSVDYTLSYRGLESEVTQAHIHFAQRSVNGGIAVWLCDAPGPPATPPGPPAAVPPVCPPASGGTVSGTFTPNELQNAGGRGLGPGTGAGNEREWDELIAAIKVGHTYANVHTVNFGGGEIRGQINDRDQKEYTGPPLFD